MRKLLALTALFLMVGLSAAFPANLNVVDQETHITEASQNEGNLEENYSGVAKQTETSYRLLSYSKSIVANNQEDSVAEIEVNGEIPIFYLPFATLEPEPDQRKRDAITKDLSWSEEIQPGETAEFVYTFHYWMPITLVAFLIGGLIVLKRKITRKNITKTGKMQGEKVKIFLDISNKTGEPMEDVELRDFAPEMLEVGEEFETAEPELEQTDHGTRLKWEIDRMEPDESRVLTYRLESDMEVESEIILRGAEIWEDSKKVNESSKVRATFPAKDST